MNSSRKRKLGGDDDYDPRDPDGGLKALKQKGASAAKCKATASSQYRGVCWNKKNHRWQSSININGKYIYLGSFTDPVEAARAFDHAAVKYRGDRAKLNFPPENPNHFSKRRQVTDAETPGQQQQPELHPRPGPNRATDPSGEAGLSSRATCKMLQPGVFVVQDPGFANGRTSVGGEAQGARATAGRPLIGHGFRTRPEMGARVVAGQARGREQPQAFRRRDTAAWQQMYEQPAPGPLAPHPRPLPAVAARPLPPPLPPPLQQQQQQQQMRRAAPEALMQPPPGAAGAAAVGAGAGVAATTAMPRSPWDDPDADMTEGIAPPGARGNASGAAAAGAGAAEDDPSLMARLYRLWRGVSGGRSGSLSGMLSGRPPDDAAAQSGSLGLRHFSSMPGLGSLALLLGVARDEQPRHDVPTDVAPEAAAAGWYGQAPTGAEAAPAEQASWQQQKQQQQQQQQQQQMADYPPQAVAQEGARASSFPGGSGHAGQGDRPGKLDSGGPRSWLSFWLSGGSSGGSSGGRKSSEERLGGADAGGRFPSLLGFRPSSEMRSFDVHPQAFHPESGYPLSDGAQAAGPQQPLLSADDGAAGKEEGRANPNATPFAEQAHGEPWGQEMAGAAPSRLAADGDIVPGGSSTSFSSWQMQMDARRSSGLDCCQREGHGSSVPLLPAAGPHAHAGMPGGAAVAMRLGSCNKHGDLDSAAAGGTSQQMDGAAARQRRRASSRALALNLKPRRGRVRPGHVSIWQSGRSTSSDKETAPQKRRRVTPHLTAYQMRQLEDAPDCAGPHATALPPDTAFADSLPDAEPHPAAAQLLYDATSRHGHNAAAAAAATAGGVPDRLAPPPAAADYASDSVPPAAAAACAEAALPPGVIPLSNLGDHAKAYVVQDEDTHLWRAVISCGHQTRTIAGCETKGEAVSFATCLAQQMTAEPASV